MEEKYSKAIREAKELAEQMLEQMTDEQLRDCRKRAYQLKSINTRSGWRSIWWRINKGKIYGISAAAAVLIAFGLLFMNQQPPVSEAPVINLMPADKSNVVLTLGNGKTIELNEEAAGAANRPAGVVIDKKESKISYENVAAQEQALEYNELSVPKGKTYSLILSDGTKVWLNAMSKIRYPVRFGASGRKVKITGEAYFEVTQQKTNPFYVETDDYTVKVLGTVFNVNAYADEDATVTTLASGSILIQNKQHNTEQQLSAGQQYHYNHLRQTEELAYVQTELYTSWINNILFIEEATLADIFKILKRRYDIEVAFDDLLTSGEKYSGKLPLNDNLGIILQQISKVANVEFVAEHYTIHVKYKTKQ